jgi:hypothetical protein
MRTRVPYRITPCDGGYVAVSTELALEATGESRDQAVAALLIAAKEALRTVEAVGPPSRPPSAPDIELVLETPATHEPDGPGDPV